MPLLIHEVENGHHRLLYVDGSKQGEWVDYHEIARLDDYAAVTHHLSNILPLVFRIIELKIDEDYQHHHLNLDSDDYWQGSKE